MPNNKNALVRYKYLDDLLSDRHHYYNIHELTERCNNMLIKDGFPEVTQRCIEKDIKFLEFGPFYADIQRFKVQGKSCIRYYNPSFSIFTKEMSTEESHLLWEVLNTIGQFDGLDHFQWLDKFKIGLGIKEHPKVISFSTNPFLKNSNLLGALFEVIANKVVVCLHYHTFTDMTTDRSLCFHPYLLKQYNNRWYVLGAADRDMAILHFALDRIDGFEPQPHIPYKECDEDLEERFEDIIGVTLPQDKQIEDILLWASDREYPFISTKPLHGSQRIAGEEETQSLRNQYPMLSGGYFLHLECIENYELKRELCSFGDGLLVLAPTHLRDELLHGISAMKEKYESLRTLCSL